MPLETLVLTLIIILFFLLLITSVLTLLSRHSAYEDMYVTIALILACCIVFLYALLLTYTLTHS